MKKTLYIFYIIIVALTITLTTACPVTPTVPDTNTNQPPYPVEIIEMTNRTVNNLVLIYMAAENNLANYAVLDMMEISSEIDAFRSKGDDVLVYIDIVKNQGVYEYYLDNDTTINSNGWYLYPGGIFHPQTPVNGFAADQRVHTNQNNNTGDPFCLAEFLEFAQSKYNYTNVFLVLWNHGSAFWPMGTNVTWGKDETPYKGSTSPVLNDSIAATPLYIALDDVAQDSLSDEEVRWAISNTITNLDALGFDGCVMGDIEVAYEYKDICDNYVASVNVEPLDGWPYHVWMAKWAAQGNTDMQSLTHTLVDAFAEVYSTNETWIYETLYSMQMPQGIEQIVTEYNDMATYIMSDTNIAKWWMMGQYYFQWKDNIMYDMTFDQNAKGIVLEHMMSNLSVNTAHAGMDTTYANYQTVLSTYVYTSTNCASPTFYKPWTLYNATQEIASRWYGPDNIKLLADYPNLYTITTHEDYILDEKTIEMFIDYTQIHFYDLMHVWKLSGYYLDNPDGVGSFDNYVTLTNNLIRRTNAIHMADFNDHYYKFIVNTGGTFRLWVATDEGLDLWNYFAYTNDLIAVYDNTRTMLDSYTAQDSLNEGYARDYSSSLCTKDSSSVTNSINAKYGAYYLDTTLTPGTYYISIRTLLSIGKPDQKAPYLMWVGTNTTAILK